MSSYSWSLYASVAIGAALGGIARFWAAGLAARLLGDNFPWGTLLINVTGSAALGFAAALTAPDGRFFVPAAMRAFVMIGLCGGFTTFSTFSLETFNLTRSGEYWRAGLNIAGNLVLCLVAVWCGYAATTLWNRR